MRGVLAAAAEVITGRQSWKRWVALGHARAQTHAVYRHMYFIVVLKNSSLGAGWRAFGEDELPNKIIWRWLVGPLCCVQAKLVHLRLMEAICCNIRSWRWPNPLKKTNLYCFNAFTQLAFWLRLFENPPHCKLENDSLALFVQLFGQEAAKKIIFSETVMS